jgi:hypothetical protein
MFSSLEKQLDQFIKETMSKRREELLNRATNISQKAEAVGIGLLEMSDKEFREISGSATEQLLASAFNKPHFTFKSVIEEPYDDEPGIYCDYKCWVTKDLKRGIIAEEEDEGYYDIEVFKIHKVGKYGRDIKTGVSIVEKKDFFEAYDDFIGDLIILGLDDTETD